MLGKRLRRQIKKIFQVEDLSSTWLVSVLQKENLESSITVLAEGLNELLREVDSTYELTDRNVGIAQQSLEVSTRELGLANAELNDLNTTIQAMVDSLSEGFLYFDQDGLCGLVYSRKAVEFIGWVPAQKSILQIFNVPPNERETFQAWYNFLFNPEMVFDEIAAIGPQTLKTADPRKKIFVQFSPVLDGSLVKGVVCILTDRTFEIEAGERAERESSMAQMIVNAMSDRENFAYVLSIVKNFAEELRQAQATPGKWPQHFNPTEVVRRLHTLKGAAASFQILAFAKLFHKLESQVVSSSQNPLSIEFLSSIEQKVQVGWLEFERDNPHLLNYVHGFDQAEKERNKKWVQEFAQMLRPVDKHLHGIFVQHSGGQSVASLVSLLKTRLMALANTNQKIIRFEVDMAPGLRVYSEQGAALFESLIHFVTNAVEHGIEDEAMRILLKKDPGGLFRIEIKTKEQGFERHFEVTMADDGRGIDPILIRERYQIKKGIALDESDEQVIYRVFEPDFSTVETLTETSGRGVGMNVIFEQVEKLKGQLTLQSWVGKGTRLQIKFMEISPVHLG